MQTDLIEDVLEDVIQRAEAKLDVALGNALEKARQKEKVLAAALERVAEILDRQERQARRRWFLRGAVFGFSVGLSLFVVVLAFGGLPPW
jgi:hypothetical protein